MRIVCRKKEQNHVSHLEIIARPVRPDAAAHRGVAGARRAVRNELQEITRLGQSRISTHLGLLADCALVQSRREGKRTFYKLNPQTDGTAGEFIQLAIRGAKELPEHGGDQINLKRILARRREQAQVYFNQVAGRFDRVYGPGRSWQAFGHLLLRILPPLVVADLGAGEGLLSELLARRCKKVIAVDNSEKIVAFGAAKAKKNG